MEKVKATVRVSNYDDAVLADRGHLSPGEVRSFDLAGEVDSRVAMLVIPPAVAERLGLPKVGETKVRYADHRTATRDVVGQIALEYAGRSAVFTAVVEPSRPDALIGAIVLEALDLLVDCRKQQLAPRDPEMMTTEIE